MPASLIGGSSLQIKKTASSSRDPADTQALGDPGSPTSSSEDPKKIMK